MDFWQGGDALFPGRHNYRLTERPICYVMLCYRKTDIQVEIHKQTYIQVDRKKGINTGR